jgi:hypothetical protein
VESLVEDFKLSACGRQPSSFSLLFDLGLSVLFLLLCFSGQVSTIHVWGSILLRYARLAPFLWYYISGHIGDNVPF